MSKLSFLDAEPAAETDSAAVADDAPAPVAAASEAAPAPAAEQQADTAAPAQPRAPDGKFAPKADAPQAATADQQPPATAPAPAAPTAPQTPAEAAFVPISAMLTERDRRQEVEKRLKDFEDAETKRKAEAQAKAPPPPQFAEDPEAHLNAREIEHQRQLYFLRRDFSERMAVKEYGREVVTQAMAWARGRGESDKAFNEAALLSPDPIEFAVQSYREDQVYQQVKTGQFTAADLEAFQAWKAAQTANPAPSPSAAAPAVLTPTPAPKPPVSLVDQLSAGGAAHVPAGPGQAYSAAFGKG